MSKTVIVLVPLAFEDTSYHEACLADSKFRGESSMHLCDISEDEDLPPSVTAFVFYTDNGMDSFMLAALKALTTLHPDRWVHFRRLPVVTIH